VSIGDVRWLPDGSYLALVYRPNLTADRRRHLVEQVRAGNDIPTEAARLVRVVEYTVPDRNPDGDLIVVVTTMLDPFEVPAIDLAAAYQQRWEEESAFGEIKTDLRGRGEVLRSKTPDLVEQQMWGLLLAHYAIRALLVDAADPAGYDPDRMSFTKGARVVRRQVTDQAAITP
jgi:IS4 transposase